MESMKTYKVSIEINGDRSYRIQQQNLFFDAFAKKEQINRSEGKLTDEEFNELTRLIADSRLFGMKNTYGFNASNNSNDDPFEGMFYRLNYTEGTQSKYILIHLNPKETYSASFAKLLNFLTDYSSNHLKK